MSDYTKKYIVNGQFDLFRMINDDFILAIKMMWNEKYYTSCLKLLVSFIDTMAFVDNGDSSGALFKEWLNIYVDLSNVGIISDELWEHRNAVLHMSTYDSRKVSVGKIQKLVPFIGTQHPNSRNDFKYYSLYNLVMAVMQGVRKYATLMNNDEVMQKRFFDNYEKTVSDTNLTKLVQIAELD